MKHFPALAGLLLLSALAMPAAAATYVMVSDPDLTDQAGVIAEVEVLAVEPSPDPDSVATLYTVSAERILKGYVSAGSMVIRVPGGTAPDGMELRLQGAPEFLPGHRALLFLVERSDGTYGILHWMLGSFRILGSSEQPVLLRNLAEAQEAQGDGTVVDRSDRFRDLGKFRHWVEDRVAGVEREADYFVQASGSDLSATTAAFTQLRILGRPTRWSQFDAGGSITFFLDEKGQAGLPNLGADAFLAALNAWTNNPGTQVRLRYGGTTSATGGLTTFDNVNAILFDNPNGNSTFDAPFSCSSGGVIAAAGPWTSTQSTHDWKGESYRTIRNADIVTNKGISCWIGRNQRAPEVFAHELGHTLGLDHSCEDSSSSPCNTTLKNDALMRAVAHGDGRGASLREDDRAGICFVYSQGDCSGSTGETPPPAAPTGLSATATSPTSVALAWQDNANNEEQFQVERRATGSFSRIATLGANSVTYTDTSASGGTTYVYRVRARTTSTASLYSNEASATTPVAGPPPAAPTSLAAATLSSSSVQLTWQDNASNESGFQVEVQTNGTFSRAATTGANATSRVISGLEPYTTHTFRLRAVGATGTSGYSNEADADTHPLDTSTPAEPSQPIALAFSENQILVTWQDNADNELAFEVEASLGAGFQSLGRVDRDVTQMIVPGVAAGVSRSYRVRAVGVNDLSPASVAVPAAITAAGSTCTASGPVACQLGARFKVEVQWRNPRTGAIGRGQASSISDQAGTFWFFNPANTELIVKVLDGRSNNGNFWIFYGALTDVEYWITVSDTVSGQVESYYNPPREICGAADTTAIAGGGGLVGVPASVHAFAAGAKPPLASLPASSCALEEGDLCLLGDRFRVHVDWTRSNGDQGVGTAVPSTDNTGLFWFFNPANVELVVKVLDGTSNNGRYWVFYGALTNVAYELTVTDTLTGSAKTYVNPQGNVCGLADIGAF